MGWIARRPTDVYAVAGLGLAEDIRAAYVTPPPPRVRRPLPVQLRPQVPATFDRTQVPEGAYLVPGDAGFTAGGAESSAPTSAGTADDCCG